MQYHRIDISEEIDINKTGASKECIFDRGYYSFNHYDVRVNKYGVKCVTLKFWEKNGWINSIDPYGWF